MQLERYGRAGREHDRERTLRTDKGTIEWKLRPCHFCVAPAPGLVHLRKVLMTVMMNRRLLCP